MVKVKEWWDQGDRIIDVYHKGGIVFTQYLPLGAEGVDVIKSVRTEMKVMKAWLKYVKSHAQP